MSTKLYTCRLARCWRARSSRSDSAIARASAASSSSLALGCTGGVRVGGGGVDVAKDACNASANA